MPYWDWAGSDDGPELWIGSGLSPIYDQEALITVLIYP